MKNIIPTRIINLKHRTDRREHIEKEFAGRAEFSIEVIEACEHHIGAIGLWQSICGIISTASQKDWPYVLICEDDHQFTTEYSPDYLLDCITECETEGGDVLLGAVSWFDSALPVNDKLYWVARFTGTQFMIIYRKFYEKILSADFGVGDNADYKIAALTTGKYFMSKPVSTQIYFGYSDVTARNAQEGRLEELFSDSVNGIDMLDIVSNYYQKEINDVQKKIPDYDLSQICLPVFIITQPETNRDRIIQEFSRKPEFEVFFIETGKKDECTNIDRWEGIREAARTGKERDEDLIIICNDNHIFTTDYSKEYLFDHIIKAHYQGIDLLLTGCRSFYRAIPVAPSRYWVAGGTAAPFLVLFKKFYDKLLEESFDENVKPAELINELTFNKMLIYPFISSSVDDQSIFEETRIKFAELEAASNRYFWPQLQHTVAI